MSIFRFFVPLILIVCGFFTIGATSVPNIHGGNPKFVPLTRTPCYIGCNYAFPYCYNYNISNMNNGIKVEDWEFDGGWAKGRAVADINANLMVKLCYQVSLAYREFIINQELDLEAGFDFKVKLGRDTPGGEIHDQCIDEEESSISYSSFALKGDLVENPVPLFSQIKTDLIEEIKSIIKHSVCKSVYDASIGDVLPENEGRKNIYCDTTQNDAEESTTICDCI